MDDAIAILVYAFYCFVCLVLPVAIVVLIIYLVTRNKSGNVAAEVGVSKVNQTNIRLSQQQLLSWLVKQKANGLVTVDQLIADLRSQTASTEAIAPITKTVNKPIKSEAPSVAKITQSTLPQTKANKGLDAQVPLYLGAVLVVFALFILVAFNWQTFSDAIKNIILALVPIGFYLVGYLLHSKEKYRQAGVTFITVGAITLGFAGIGFWNFGLGNLLKLDFNIYWSTYSLLLIVVYGINYQTIKRSWFIYVVIAAVYSLFVSVAFSLSTDWKFRIVIAALLNLVFFSLKSLTGDFAATIAIASKIVNYLLEFCIFITLVIVLALGFNDIQSQVLATIVLLIPTVFALMAFRKDQQNDLLIELLILPIKFIFLVVIWQLDFRQGLWALLVFSVVLCLSSFTIMPRYLKPVFSTISTVYSYILGAIVIFCVMGSWLAALSISQAVVTESILGYVQDALILLILGAVYSYREWKLQHPLNFGLTLVPVVMAVYRLISHDGTPAINYIICSVVLLGIALIISYAGKKYKNSTLINELAASQLLTVIVLVISALGSIPMWSNIYMAFAFLTLYFILGSYLYKSFVLKIFSVFTLLIAWSSLLLYVADTWDLTMQQASMFNLTYFALALGGLILYEYRYAVGKRSIYAKWLIIANVFVGLLSTVADNGAFLWANIITAALFMFLLLRYKWQLAAVLFSVIWNIAVFTAGIYFKLENPALLWAMLIAPVTTLLLSLGLYSNPQFKQAGKYFAIATNIVALYLLPVLLMAQTMDSGNNYYWLITVVITLIFAVQNLMFANDLWILGLVVTNWMLTIGHDVNAQVYIVPVTVGFAASALLAKYRKSHTMSIIWEACAYILQLTSLFFQSIFANDTDAIIYGAFLIVLAIVATIFNSYRKQKGLMVIALVFLFLELLIRLFAVILLIPWWIYLGVLGIGLMVFGVFLAGRLGKK